MPELPEVETTLRGISPFLTHHSITDVIIRRTDLRLEVNFSASDLANQPIQACSRRSKYILLHLPDSCLLIHLGMSGNLRICDPETPWKKHDHLALCLNSGLELRFHDPRRFGLFIQIPHNPFLHPLLSHLGPEPLSDSFTPNYLSTCLASRNSPIKSTIMNAEVVVGVGNIYASESLFLAKIHPLTPAASLTKKQVSSLISAIQTVLSSAIQQGGTTLRDFVNSEGKPGYFQQQLAVYGKTNQPCQICKSPIAHSTLANRATYWCPRCQRLPKSKSK